ncbi:MAG: FAD-dependent oxidoreductase [Candidatus Eisenbacteria bacterium]|nr:FAD-dependent oxidoreductase [Candidatus Eisenbacteria bacterium]
MVKVEINGRTVETQPGRTILDVVEEHGLDRIPTLCHSPELKPYGSCFVCVVEVEGRPNLLPACSTRVAEGMKIHTRNERVIRSRRTALELLLSNHYADCLSPCKLGCPAGVDAQGYIALAAMGQTRKAVDLIRETNPLPAICGRICVRKCEVVCRRQDVDSPVGINFVKRHVTDQPGVYNGNPEREPSKGKTVGIVGSGPAGLTAAWFLGRKGYDAVIYEAMEKTGGMLRYGIPEYRLPKDVLDREVEFITRAGVEIRTGVRVGGEVALEELRKKHDAVFLAPGAFRGKGMRVEHEFDTEGVVTGADFLVEKADRPEPVEGTVVVVGGGNTAMDVARTSWRLGAEKVILLYRRTKAEMPADPLEIEDCIREGIEILELAAPVGIVREGNRLKALRCIRMTLGEPDASGRRRPVPLEGSEFDLPCRLAVSAIGQEPILEDLLEKAGAEAPGVSRWKTFEVDTRTMRTNVEGLFAGGDAADDGPTVVIDAIRDGGRAARAIHAFLSGEELPAEPFAVRKEFWSKPGRVELGDVPESPRHHLQELDVEERRGNFREVAVGFEWEDVIHEQERCLSCGCVAFDDCKLREYAEEYGVDMERFAGQVRKHKTDDRHPYIIYDPNKCILCARCIRTCDRVLPISALGLTNRGFRTEMRPAMNDPLVQTSCISCGNCIDACPTGALEARLPFPGRSPFKAEREETHCGFCSIGCPITVRRISEDRYWIESSGKPGDYLCQYGRFGHELFIKGRRLIVPTVREGSRHRAVGFRDAYALAVEGLRGAAEHFGPESVAVFVSPELTNEELYLAGLVARDGLGTNNVGSIALMETGVRAATLDRSFGFTGSTADRSVLREADLILCNNTDTQAEHAVLSSEIVCAVKEGGARLVVSNSSPSPLDSLAALSLDPMRGRSAAFWNGVIQLGIDEGWLDREAIRAMPGGSDFLDDPHDYSLAAAAERSGVEAEKIREAARLVLHARRVVVIHSPDRSRDLAPGDVETLANLVLLLRGKGIPADLILPSMAANGAGVELSGADPAFAAGRAPAPALPGAKNREDLLRALREGRIRAALVVGEDPMGYNKTASYLGNVEFLAAVDWARTETTLFADVAIPGSTYLESEGTRVNFEGRAIRFQPAAAPLSGMKGWRVLRNLADHLGVSVPAVFPRIEGALWKAAREGLGDRLPFYLGDGDRSAWDGKGTLVIADVDATPYPRTPALTEIAQYKRDVHEVGLEHFRVGARRA